MRSRACFYLERDRERRSNERNRLVPVGPTDAEALVAVVSMVARAAGVSKTYGKGPGAVTVLSGVDLEVQAGEFVTILGKSGSGKSTLLHLLGGLDRPDAGTVEVDGVRLDTAGERDLARLRRSKIGFVFQSFHLLRELSGLENVLLPARLAHDGDALRRGRRLVGELGLSRVAERLPAVLSGGEQQRLAVARALVNDPLLVLADEPTGNLDEESAALVLDLLKQIARSGKAVLLITHDSAAVQISDRVLHLRGGVIGP